jgi:hypothetical protein
MGSLLSAVRALQLPVRLHGIQLGQPIDLLIEPATWQALGFVVLCGDDSVRFLPFVASQPADDEIALASALMLLEDVDFYETRSRSLRSLLGCDVQRGRRAAGELRDVLIGPGGAIAELEVEGAAGVLRVPSAGSTVVAATASAA